MSVQVINPQPLSKQYSFNELEVGVLYKLAKGVYDTVYIKTFQDTLVWFEEPQDGQSRIGYAGAGHTGKFVRAPEGTKVILT